MNERVRGGKNQVGTEEDRKKDKDMTNFDTSGTFFRENFESHPSGNPKSFYKRRSCSIGQCTEQFI